MSYDLVFEGGGAKGIAFVGAMDAFLGRGLTFNRLMGTSAGAITATFLAAGYTIDEVQAALEETTDDGRPIFETFMGEPTPFSDEELTHGALQKLLDGIDWTFLPDFVERFVDEQLTKILGNTQSTRNLVGFIERGGWYSADSFLAWLRRYLDQGEVNGRPRRYSHMTLAEFNADSGRDLTLIAADTTAARLLILNHRTAPQCPLVWAVRMSMSVPLLWEEVLWQESWGTYRGRDIAGHAVVDGGLLSNFPIELYLSRDPQVTDVMGENHGDEVIGFLLDETLPVPGGTPRGFGVEFNIDVGDLATVRRLHQLVNTATQAHDKEVIETFEHLVVRLPAMGYGTTEFNMTESKRAALVEAGRATTALYLDQILSDSPPAGPRGTGVPTPTPQSIADQHARRIVSDPFPASRSVERIEAGAQPTGDKPMSKGISLHIGLNRVDPNHYRDSYGNPWEGPLAACEFDAQSMQAIADAQGFQSQILLTAEATAENVIAAINAAAENLGTGDTFFLSYAGHGAQVPDTNGDEEDEMDETWCLFNRQLVDDELFALWSQFAPGVRIIMLSDSCHSGTVAKDPTYQAAKERPGAMRVAPIEVQAATYRTHRSAYDQIQTDHPDAEDVDVQASVLLISGCKDDQVSYDGVENGLFTGNLLAVWAKGAFAGDYTAFWQGIVARMPAYQEPNLFVTGVEDSTFLASRPFTL